MRIRKLTLLLCACIFLCGCAMKKESEEDSQQESVSIAEQYSGLEEENHFDVTDRDTLQSILEHGTACVFFGFPECPWCQAYVPMLEEVLAENNALCSYYNIYADKKSDRDFYDVIADLLISQNDTGQDIIEYDNDGKAVIYMPLIVFVEKGRITAFDNETCTEDSSLISAEEYWTEEKKAALKEKLSDCVKRIVTLQGQNNAKGCDTGCQVGD